MLALLGMAAIALVIYSSTVLDGRIYFLGAALLAAAATARCMWRRRLRAPRLFYGSEMSSILEAMPLMNTQLSQPVGISSGLMQVVIFAVQYQLQPFCCPYEFEREEVDVDLDGRFHDKVALQWLKRPDEASLPADAPIIVMCPGLCNYEKDLPGTNLYRQLLKRPWRAAVYLKRGLAGPIHAPVLHVFGHPSDLKAAVKQISARYPSAPIHMVCFSSGNGLGGSMGTMYDAELTSVRSYLLLCGGCDYQRIMPDKPMWPWTELLFTSILKPSVQEKLIAPHKAVLCEHDAAGYAKVMAAKTFQEMYDMLVTHFGGYKDGAESEAKVNGFLGGNARLCDTLRTPFLSVYTEDDPVSPGGPRPDWLVRYTNSSHAACALFPNGSHLACYESFDLSVRWVDRLVLQWIDAVIATHG